MKIEKLSSNKIRVTVTPSELTVWDINPQAISPDSPQLKEFIASLLAQSAEETGFDLASTSILVEARPQGNDFVFVITQLAYGIEETRKELTRAISLCFMAAAIGILFSTLFQALGLGFNSLLVSLLRQIIILLPAAYLLSKISLDAVWYAFVIAEFFSLIASILIYWGVYRRRIRNLQ